MKAIRVIGVEEIEYVDVPKPEIGVEDVLIKVMAVGVCGTDMELYTGEMPYIKKGLTTYPFIPGHEWSGCVEQVGAAVKEFQPGDRVTGDVSIGCGHCHMCKIGRFNLCPNRRVVGSYRNLDGAYAEYIKLPRKNVYKLPDNLSYEEAALIEPAAPAAYGVLKSGMKFGDSVLVVGDGPIGLLAVQCAKIAGASKIFVSGSWDEKLEVAIKTGADYVMNYKRDNLEEIIHELTEGAGVDVVFETSGNVKAFNQSMHAVKPGGKVVLLSIYTSPEFMAEINTIVSKDADVIGVLASCNTFKPTIKMLENGSIDVKPLITHQYPLEKAKDVLEMMKTKNECRIKVLLIP